MKTTVLGSLKVGDLFMYRSNFPDPAYMDRQCSCIYKVQEKLQYGYRVVNVRPCKCAEEAGTAWEWGDRFEVIAVPMENAMSRVEEAEVE